MKILAKKGITSKKIAIFIQDSSSTTGAGLTGLTNASAGLVCYRYREDDGNVGGTQIALAAGTRGTWSSGGFVEKDATNMPGVYEFGIPDNVLASGANWAIIMLKGATNMAPLVLEIQLVDVDLQDSTAFGLSRLDATVSSRMATFTLPANFSILVIDANGRVDVSKWLGAAVNALIQGKVDSCTSIRNGTAQAGAATSITLDASASAITDLYKSAVILILAGTGAGQVRECTAYNGSTKVASIAPNWATNPDGTSVFLVMPADGVVVGSDAKAILSSDAHPGVVIPTVTTVTNLAVKKNQALNAFEFEMIDSTDHVSAKTLLTVTAQRSIDGGAYSNCANAVTEIGNGTYKIDLAASDLNGNVITLKFTSAGADTTKVTIITQG